MLLILLESIWACARFVISLFLEIHGLHTITKTSGTADILVAHDRDWMIPPSQGTLGTISAGPGDFFSHLYKGLRDANGTVTKCLFSLGNSKNSGADRILQPKLRNLTARCAHAFPFTAKLH